MIAPRGMLSLEDLCEQVNSDSIDTVLVVFTDLYGRFMGKRFDARFFLDQVASGGTHCCDYLLTVDMEMTPVPGYQYSNWEKGYGDFHLTADLKTLRVATWLEKTALCICDISNEQTESAVPFSPRAMLRKQIENADQLNFNPFAGSELEYYLFENSYREASQEHYSQLTPVGWYIEDYHMLQGAREEFFNGAVRRHLSQSGITVECTKGEWGEGQHELNVRYCDVLTMADNHSVYKQCLKEVADQLGVSVTFMAKYSDEHAGSSSHIHLSLWQQDKNIFPGDEQLGPVKCSDTFRWFLGGWLAHASEMMVFYAPNVNSYKRYQSGSWAPTRLAWSNDNRTAGFRIVGSGQSLRIECRIPGADCNPYLAYTAALASGLDGIVNKIEPPDAHHGDVYVADDIPEVPRSLAEATKLFENSEFAKKALGNNVVEHYTHFFKTEQACYDKAVTDWERRRYFERI